MPFDAPRFHSSARLCLWLIVLCAIARAAVAAPQQVPASLQPAMTAFDAKDYTRAAVLARVAGDRESGLARESARYLEGLAQFKAGNLDAAAEALRVAAASNDRYIAGQANVTLGSVEIERKKFDAAAHAYRRAAGFLDPAEARRAHSIAARCFDAAGQTALADASRDAAGEPRRPQPQPSPAVEPSAPAPAPSTTAVPATKPPLAIRPAEPRRTVTADDKPSTESAPSIAPIRFAIQAGAFRSAESAASLASQLGPSCRDLKLSPPRVIATDDAKGSLYLVQFGDFPNRGAATKMLLKFPRSAYRVERRLDDAVTQADSP